MFKCNKCLESKHPHEFYSDKTRKSGYSRWCKCCMNKQNRKWKSFNKDRIKSYMKDYRSENQDQIKITSSQYRQKKATDIRKAEKHYRLKNKDKLKTWKRNYYHTVLKFDPEWKLLQYNRKVLNKYLKDKKDRPTKDFIGCTIQELKLYLESQFTEDMSWENYGEHWHVDHVIPCKLFDLNVPEERLKCFHYSNLQPLRASENMSKQDKLTEYAQRRFWNGERWCNPDHQPSS